MKQKFIRTVAVIATLVCAVSAGDVIMVPSTGIRTISQAIVRARSGDTIIVADGIYREDVFVTTGVYLRAQHLHGAVIDGDGRGTVVTLAGSAGIEGFEIRNGTIGIFSRDADVVIRRNRVVRNWMTGILVLRHCPTIEDNIIAFNRGSGIVGWNLRAARGAIEHNTIAYNANFGLQLGGVSNVEVQNNTIAFNQRFGLRVNSESAEASTIRHNNFWENLRQFHDNPEGNFSFDPAFIAARVKYDFNPEPTLCCAILSTAGENLGARLSRRR
ncbi:MAG: right-handed parallel beta-helix repeat-containing protein [Chitinivibrionia bacterium]|jgi:hypothetical protein|nr:right-handed parallel beta-helix repeat-containing protein [Chitinivibrionia bacterium]